MTTRVVVAGLGKMGLSHLSMIRPHPDVEVVGVVDPMKYVLDVLGKNTGLATFTDYEKCLDATRPDAVVIATPTHLHTSMIEAALERDIHVFAEKPFVLDPADGQRLADLARARGLVTAVGYHNRHVGAFREVRRLLDLGAIGQVNSALAQAYGPVVLKPQGSSWRTRRSTGGGCLYDYAAHPLDLLTWYLGEPLGVEGAQMTSIFSAETDDAVAASIRYGGAMAQLNVHWSDESQRKMSTRMTLWGTKGKIYADRQEIQVYLFGGENPPAGYGSGWNVRYTTELQEAPFFYVRGEEYSTQLDDFVARVRDHRTQGVSTFDTALVTDRLIASIAEASARTDLVRWQPADRPDGDPAARPLLTPERRAAVRRELSGAAREALGGVRARWRRAADRRSTR